MINKKASLSEGSGSFYDALLDGSAALIQAMRFNGDLLANDKGGHGFLAALPLTCPLQASPDSEIGFSGIWERRQDGQEIIYPGRHHWAFTDHRDRVGQRRGGPGRMSEPGHL